MAEYTISKIKLPNGDICNIKNTWRGIQDNLTSSTNTTESLSAKQGYLLANGSARDSTKITKISSSTDNAIVRFDGTSSAIQNSGVIIDDDNNVAGIKTLCINYYSGYDLCKFQTSQNCAEIVIKTKFKFVSSATMPRIHISGYSYGMSVPFDIILGYYIYGNEFHCGKVISTGGCQPDIYLFKYTENDIDYVAIGLKANTNNPLSYLGFSINASGGATGSLIATTNTNLSTIGWTVTSIPTSETTMIIPAVGTDKCKQWLYTTIKTNVSSTTAANLTTTANAIAYYTNTTGTFGTKASANGALYATSANGALQWGTLPVPQGGTGATTAENARINLGLGSMATETAANYLKLSGGIMTNSLGIAKAGECGLEVNNTQSTNPNQVAFIVGSSGNGGIFSRKHSKWIVYSDANGNVVLNGNANTASAVALSGVTGADDLKAIEALSGTSGFLKKTAANTWTLDTNTYLTSSTGVTSIAGQTGDVTLADLGLSQALRFIGITSTSLSDGATTSTLVAKSDGSLIKTTGFVTGDVVIDINNAYEYVWAGNAWERLGGDSSYKTTQTAKSDPTASTTTSTTFIDTISQDANGVITATKKTLPSYVPTSAGVTAVTWDSTNNKLTRTINGSAADVVTIGTIKTALALTKSDVGLGNVANSTYAGGTAITLNNSSKASSTASFYAPTTGGTADTQALVGNGATTAPKWVDISPSITIEAGTSSAAPTVNVTVLGQSGTAKSITTASTSVYGVTKLNDGITSSSTSLAATANSALVAAKKVASSNTASKLYLVGAISQSTTGVDSYSYQYTYTNNGLLSALKVGLNLNGTEKAHLEWNDTDQSIDFIFE